MMDGPIRPEGVYLFEQFRLDPVSRTLTRNDARVPLAARLFDTLLFLVESQGRLVSRHDLMQAVWPARTVEDASVAMAISSLRTALKQHGAAENLIITAPGRGYRFGCHVVFEPAPRAPLPTPLPPVKSARRVRHALLIAAAAACAIALWRLTARQPSPVEHAPATPPHSIAVLPFTNLGGDPHEAYFAEGLSEELINALGRTPGLQVAARLSSFSFTGKQVTVADIARQLHVALVLEGSVRRDGPRIRVIAQLIDAATGFQVWSHSYDTQQGDILALQGQLAESVISSLRIVLLPTEVARLTAGGTANPRAFDAYLSGLPKVGGPDDDSERQAITALTEAIALDPNYAAAYAQRARALANLATNGVFADVAQGQAMMASALSDAQRAIALAPDLAESHAALGFVLTCGISELGRAAAEYARALELAPGDATILMRNARFQLAMGHIPLAVELAEHAVALDPLTGATYRTLARILAYAQRYDDALTALRRARSLPPANAMIDRIDLAFVQMSQGDAAAAHATCGAARDPYDLACLAWADHVLGRQQEAESALAKMRDMLGNNAAYLYATIYAQWGRPKDALDWLATAYRQHDAGLLDMKVDPRLESLRANQTYKDIEKALGFPP
jgi:serine/threonine-protein kinase